MKRTVRVGPVSIPIYRHTDRAGHESWTVTICQHGRRARITRASWEAARDIATTKAAQIASGQALAAGITTADAQSWARAAQSIPAGQNLESFVAAAAQALATLPTGVTLAAAAEFYREKHQPTAPITVAALVAATAASKRQDGASERWATDIEQRGAQFANAFPGQASALRGPDMDQWLRAHAKSAKTRNNMRAVLQTLFAYARRREYLPRDWHEMEAVSVAREEPREITIFTPSEFATLLTRASPSFLPFLLFAGFTGLRSAEIARLDWTEVRADHLIVTARKAKTAARRVVPLCAALQDWLSAIRRPTGPVMLVRWIGSAIARHCSREGFTWRHNALRHSFISYRLAATQDAARVALESGNTPAIIFRHYREIVSNQEAADWFNLCPKTARTFPA